MARRLGVLRRGPRPGRGEGRGARAGRADPAASRPSAPRRVSDARRRRRPEQRQRRGSPNSDGWRTMTRSGLLRVGRPAGDGSRRAPRRVPTNEMVHANRAERAEWLASSPRRSGVGLGHTAAPSQRRCSRSSPRRPAAAPRSSCRAIGEGRGPRVLIVRIKTAQGKHQRHRIERRVRTGLDMAVKHDAATHRVTDKGAERELRLRPRASYAGQEQLRGSTRSRSSRTRHTTYTRQARRVRSLDAEGVVTGGKRHPV